MDKPIESFQQINWIFSNLQTELKSIAFCSPQREPRWDRRENVMTGSKDEEPRSRGTYCRFKKWGAVKPADMGRHYKKNVDRWSFVSVTKLRFLSCFTISNVGMTKMHSSPITHSWMCYMTKTYIHPSSGPSSCRRWHGSKGRVGTETKRGRERGSAPAERRRRVRRLRGRGSTVGGARLCTEVEADTREAVGGAREEEGETRVGTGLS